MSKAKQLAVGFILLFISGVLTSVIYPYLGGLFMAFGMTGVFLTGVSLIMSIVIIKVKYALTELREIVHLKSLI
jgi:hypothetical protein